MNPRLAKLWTVQDLADFLDVPVKTIYSWRSAGYGPKGRKVGRFDGLTDEVA